jgi:hypothetical protein
MTQKKVEIEDAGIDSKFTRILLTLVSVVLLFVGPTYIPYLMADVAGIEYFASIGVGAVLFIFGLVLLVYLIRKKVIT